MLSQVRAPDMAFRYGGEEFVILTPETESKPAINLAERIRLGFKTRSSLPTGTQTLSIGIADTSMLDKTREITGRRLFKLADAALYGAKRGDATASRWRPPLSRPSSPRTAPPPLGRLSRMKDIQAVELSCEVTRSTSDTSMRVAPNARGLRALLRDVRSPVALAREDARPTRPSGVAPGPARLRRLDAVARTRAV